MHDSRGRYPAIAALVAALVLGASACASDGSSGAQDEPAPEPQEADAAVEVTLVDYAFENLPASLPAGSRLTVSNEAEAELHELVAFRLPDGEDRSVAELSELSPPELVEALGEPSAVLIAEPGGPAIPAVGDGTLTEPGRYAIMCFIPTGADPQEYLRVAAETEEGPPQVEGGPPHFVHGMYGELEID